jgi:hypothetical protein
MILLSSRKIANKVTNMSFICILYLFLLTLVGIIELYFCFIILKQNHYEKSIQEAKNRTRLQQFRAILSTSVATGAAIAKYSGKPKTAGIISAGLSLVTGLITAMDDDATGNTILTKIRMLK